MPRKKKTPMDLTTDELAKKVFPKKFLEFLKTLSQRENQPSKENSALRDEEYNNFLYKVNNNKKPEYR